jgi:hypothetical protein
MRRAWLVYAPHSYAFFTVLRTVSGACIKIACQGLVTEPGASRYPRFWPLQAVRGRSAKQGYFWLTGGTSANPSRRLRQCLCNNDYMADERILGTKAFGLLSAPTVFLDVWLSFITS